METGMVWTQSRIFTPHGIEDIMRRETRIVVDDDSERDSEVDSYQHGDRDSLGHLNLSVQQCDQTESDSYKSEYTNKEMKSLNHQTEKILRRKKLRTTFTGRQIFELEKMFETKKYLTASERSSLSRSGHGLCTNGYFK